VKNGKGRKGNELKYGITDTGRIFAQAFERMKSTDPHLPAAEFTICIIQDYRVKPHPVLVEQ
jgi:hypothetical protein